MTDRNSDDPASPKSPPDPSVEPSANAAADAATGAAADPLPAEPVIDRFGGIRPMATKLGVAVTTVQGWKGRGTIPPGRRDEVLAGAAAHGIDLSDILAGPSASASASPSASPSSATGIDAEDADAASAERTTAEGAAPESAKTATEKTPGTTTPGTTTPGSGSSPWTSSAGAGTQGSAEQERREAGVTEDATETPHPPATPPPATPDSRGAPGRPGGGVAWVALFLAIAAILAALTQGLWYPPTLAFLEREFNVTLGPKSAPHSGPASGPATATADAQAAPVREAIDAALAPLEQQLARLGGGVSDVQRQMQAQLDALEQRLTAAEGAGGVEGAPGGGPGGGTLAALESAARSAAELAADALRQDLESAVAALEDTLSAVQDRLAALESAPREAVTEATDDLRAELAQTQDRLSSLQGDLFRLSEQVAAARDRTAFQATRAAALGLAVSQLDAAVRAGQPYGAAFDLARTLAADEVALAEALAPLADAKARGVATRAELTRRFHSLAPQLAPAAPDGDWIDKMMANLGSVVRVRRVRGGEASPVTEAERAMADDDLEGAVQALDGAPLQGTDGAVEDWLADARERLAAEAALAALNRELTVLLGAARSAGGAGGGAG